MIAGAGHGKRGAAPGAGTGGKRGARPEGGQGVASRRAAVEALTRIERDRAYANLVLPAVLGRSGLGERDRALVTEIVYGATRMQRACDWIADRHLTREVEPQVRAALRAGVYQLVFCATPAHAAVDATVGALPRRVRGIVNAVLRRVADEGPPESWPAEGVRLSYPDWIVELFLATYGEEGLAALERMNTPPEVIVREDGYVQDTASQWVCDLVGASPGQRVADLCAGPGGKATALATAGAWVAASDLRPARAGLVSANAERHGLGSVAVVVADGTVPPYRPRSFDRVLVDAPCSGLGVLRRRPDARWRIRPDDVPRLAALQRELLVAGAELLVPGGRLVYSVCTLTGEETTGVDRWVAAEHPELEALESPDPPWVRAGRGAVLMPQAADTDGMYVLLLGRVS